MDKIISTPTVILELHPGLTPEQGNIEIRIVGVSTGWVGAAQMIAAALGPALVKAFAQLQQKQEPPRVVIPQGWERGC